nr:MAG TPA: hypothetical protein [Caudoviricetes sp.]
MSRGTACSPFSPFYGVCLWSFQPDSCVTYRLHRCFIPWRSTSKRAARVHAYYARFRSAYVSQDKPLTSGFKNS